MSDGKLAMLRDAANAALAAGDNAEALTALTELLPHDRQTSVLLNIGVCHYRLGDAKTAMQFLEDAHNSDPTDAKVIGNAAVISSESGAPRFFDKTVLSPQTWNEVGLNLYFHGDFDGARDALERAIALKPDYFTAYHNICDLIDDADSALWLAKARRLSPTADEDVAAVQYMMAHLHDKRGEFELAAKAMLKGGAHRRLTFDPVFSAEGHRKLTQSFIDTFDRAAIEKLRAPSGGADMIFIVGMPRSGSTLTARVLSAEPDVADLGEMRTFPQALIDELERLGGGERAPLTALTADSMQRIADAYLAVTPGEACVRIDKYLENSLFLGILHAALPDAKIVETRRDPYDTMLSCLSKNFTMGNGWSYRPEDIRAYYDDYVAVMDHWRRSLPANAIYVSDHDRLTADPETVVAELSAHCGVQASANLKSGGQVKTASAMQVRDGIKRRKTSRYEGYKPFITF